VGAYIAAAAAATATTCACHFLVCFFSPLNLRQPANKPNNQPA